MKSKKEKTEEIEISVIIDALNVIENNLNSASVDISYIIRRIKEGKFKHPNMEGWNLSVTMADIFNVQERMMSIRLQIENNNKEGQNVSK